MTPISGSDKEAYGSFVGNRWVQLVTAVISMIMIANLQYAWTLFSTPLRDGLKVSLAAVQYAFTLFIMFETFVQPLAGYLLDRFGARLMFTSAGLLVGIGWAMMGQVQSIAGLYFFYALAGVGAAVIYGGSISVAVRWFPDRRGMASGLIAAGFGMGALPFLPVIAGLLKSGGPALALMSTGIIQGIIIMVAAQILRYPVSFKRPAGGAAAPETVKPAASRGFTFQEMFVTPHFWLLWVMFLSVNIGGLLITAQTKPFGQSIQISAAAILTAVAVQNLVNGCGRMAWGWVSDKIGRYRTMGLSFGLNAIFLFLLPYFAHSDGMYILMTALIIGTWGQCFALFPAANADIFGTTYAATNYGFLYSAKGFASIFGGGLGAYLAHSFGWTIVFSAAAGFSLFAALMSLVLPRIAKPVRRDIATEGKTIQG
ncbi:oxalate/formate antiporter [Lucifera butyrica]|uniref:Oxalate/formate antiporter n=1 Tax=Lucifera butyrica TaxID=1351585 RepID=A0A498R8X6_9FIRM|nr:oxalate/formate MFS antiporter [Lucifera butyrica]VBB07831.1 oxalate/formate antiporter [Lucifera butyrica]